MIKAVIFDMDGLLIDSEPFWRLSHRQALAEIGHAVTEDDVRQMAGRRTHEVTKHWQERFGFEDPSHELLAEQIVDKVIANIHHKGQAMAGVDRLIKELHEHGMPMAVASSSASRLIDAVLEKLGVDTYMHAVHSGEHEKRGKPFPDVFLSAAKSLSVEPKDCLVFEDSLNGVKAATAAGMCCIAVPETPFDRAEFEAAGADRIVDSLAQVHWSDVASF
jgi:HAD superfamily hydrolase (TIGR01509 family)